MASKKLLTFCVAGLVASAIFAPLVAPVSAQSGLTRSRLASAPPYRVQQSTVVGTGDVWWALNGSTLEVSGYFKGLASSATIARIHMGQMTGVQGNAVLDLDVETAEDGQSGLITGSVNLSSGQVEALRDGRLYLQLNSEGTENGHLQGWLLQ
jgi:hypothetical protein